jgi:hypothetical protein
VIFEKVRDFFSSKPHQGLDRRPIWFLDENKWQRLRTELSSFALGHLTNLRENGFTVIEGNISGTHCDDIVRDFEQHCAKNEKASEYRDEYGYYSRLGSLHMESEAARAIPTASNVKEILTAAFATEFTVCGSLYFDKGSEQSIHRDTPAFFTNPINRFFGVWTALQDVMRSSGPLIYYPKGHLVVSDLELRDRADVTMHNYNQIVEEACKSAGLKLTEFYPKKGDTLIWLPELPHGGAAISSPQLSRRSMVFHCIERGVPIYPPKVFFDRNSEPSRAQNYPTIAYNGVDFFHHGPPVFFHNRYEGNFDEI